MTHPAIPDPDHAVCKSCPYFVELLESGPKDGPMKPGEGSGWCHFLPPVAVSKYSKPASAFPVTVAGAWCGQHPDVRRAVAKRIANP